MTMRSLGHDVGSDSFREVFDNSPAQPVYTSACAEAGFVAGLAGVLSAPFSLLMALCLGLGAVGVLTSIVGLARASRRDVAGGQLAAIGLVCSLATLALVSVRFAGIETTVGDSLVPMLHDWLRSLNSLVPQP